MKLLSKFKALTSGAALALGLAAPAQAGLLTGVAVLNITGITESSLTAANMTTARTLLTTAGATITNQSAAAFSAADLTGINILYVGLANNAFTNGQVSLINSYVAGGGGLVAVGTERPCCFGAAWEEIANSFGLFGLGGDRNVKANPTTASSPIVNGPFGVATSYVPAATGAFNAALPAGATSVWEGVDNNPVIVTLDVIGRAFFFADTNFMQNSFIGNGGNQTIWGNAFAFTSRMDQPAAVPEPASLALVGLALAGLVAARRRKA